MKLDSLQLHFISSENASEALLIWQKLENNLGVKNISNSVEWLKNWIAIYGDTVSYRFVVGVCQGQPVGITIITEEKMRPLPLPVRAFHIGTSGEPFSDALQMIRNTILVHEQYRKEFMKAITEAINVESKWEEMVLHEYEEKTAEDFIDVVESENLKYSVRREACRFFDFTAINKTQDSFLSNFSRETRYTIRRSIRALESDISIEWAENTEQAFDILDELIELYNKKWQAHGKKGMFASSRFLAFQKEIIRSSFHKGSIILCRVKSSKYGTLGCLYMFVNNGMTVGYQIGLRDFSEIPLDTINKKRLRIGFIVHSKCMEECYKRGIRAYNFGAGEYAYKNELTNSVSYSVSISVQNSVKPKLREAIVSIYGSSLFQNTLHTAQRSLQLGLHAAFLLQYGGIGMFLRNLITAY